MDNSKSESEDRGKGLDAAAAGTTSDAIKEPEENLRLEDDLDDLDGATDLLDDFDPESASTSALDGCLKDDPSQSTLQHSDGNLDGDVAEEFSKQLQEQMAALLGNDEQSSEVKAEIDEMMKELGNASNSTKGGNDEKRTKTSSRDSGFQETVRRTLDRIQSSGETASAAAAEGSEEDFLAQMLKSVEGMDLDEGEGDEGFSKMLMGMMEKLTDKDILYEPMKELSDKFPRWLDENRKKTGPEDMSRYETQQRVVSEIVQRFQRPEYSDTCTTDREYIVDRMQQMQAAGSPPADLIGDTGAAQEVLGNLDSGCAPQ